MLQRQYLVSKLFYKLQSKLLGSYTLAGLEKVMKHEFVLEKQAALGLGPNKRAIRTGGTG